MTPTALVLIHFGRRVDGNEVDTPESRAVLGIYGLVLAI